MSECQACRCLPMPKDPANELVCPVCKKAQPNWQGYYFGGAQSYPQPDARDLRVREQAKVWWPGSPSTVNGDRNA